MGQVDVSPVSLSFIHKFTLYCSQNSFIYKRTLMFNKLRRNSISSHRFIKIDQLYTIFKMGHLYQVYFVQINLLPYNVSVGGSINMYLWCTPVNCAFIWLLFFRLALFFRWKLPVMVVLWWWMIYIGREQINYLVLSTLKSITPSRSFGVLWSYFCLEVSWTFSKKIKISQNKVQDAPKWRSRIPSVQLLE